MADSNKKQTTVLDHIAIAVNSFVDGKKIFADLGLEFSPHVEVVEREGVSTLFAPLSNGVEVPHVELLAPYGENGPIHQYLNKKGPGIHHLCFRVEDIHQKCQELKSKGYQLIYEAPKSGARGMMVNFIHPKSTGGVLIEIVQHAERINH